MLKYIMIQPFVLAGAMRTLMSQFFYGQFKLVSTLSEMVKLHFCYLIIISL